MLKTEKVIVVEGKYDAIRLANIVDAAIIRTDGFGVFNDEEKQELLRTLAEKRGLLVLTDGDSAGMLIRNYIRGLVPESQITDVYVPDIYGKEKRKRVPSKEGKLGVEGIPDDILIAALKQAGVGDESKTPPTRDGREITRLDFYRDGLNGGPGAKEKRLRLQKALGLPERMTGKQLLRVINMMVTYDEYQSLVNIALPEPVKTALDLLETEGYEAFVVGGCTRDSLLGNTPGDWDITTSALPEQMKAVFADFRTIETGLKHGTLTVCIDKMNLEITTFRVDGTYQDARHPDEVSFTRSLPEDLARRDFTMNAIAYSPKRGWVDLYSGAEDLENHLIRCVGDPETRFTEDALRILRALRFASVLGFDIEEKTAAAIHALKSRILYVAWERISAELLKLLCGNNVYRILQEYRDVFAVLFPELEPCFDFLQHNPWHCYDVYTHIAKSVEAVRPEPEFRLAMLLHDIGKPETFFLDEEGIGHFYGHPKVSARMAEDIVLRLRLSNAQKKEITTLVENHDVPLEPDRKILRRRLNKFGKTTLWNLIEVNRADLSAQNPEKTGPELDKLRTIEETLEDLLRERPAVQVSDLEVGGKDLIDLGVPPGPEVGRLLEAVLQKVMAEELPNDRVQLLEYIAGKVL